MDDRKGWVPCPKLTLDTELTEPLYVPQSRCLSCGGCAEASKVALSELMVVPRDAEKFRESKRHLHGRCPRTHNWCNASRQFCIYNMVCSDDHARSELRFCIKEEKMFISKDKNGNLTAVDKKVKNIKDIEIDANLHAVYESKQQLVLVKTLLPVNKESEIGGLNLKAPDLKAAKIILADKDGKPVKDVSSQEFLDEIKQNTALTGLVVSGIYQPTFELKKVQLATPKKKTVKKAVVKDDNKGA